MTQFNGTLDVTNADLVYQTSFGDLPDGTTYYQWPAREMSEKMIEAKAKKHRELAMEGKAFATDTNEWASGTSFSATSGNLQLIPFVTDETITDRTKFDTPMWSGILKRVTNRGLFAVYKALTAKGAAAFKSEDAALPEADDTYTTNVTAIKYCYSTGRITGPALAGAKHWKNIMQLEQTNKMQTLAEHMEKQIFEGTTNDANGFSGLRQLVTTNASDQSGTGTVSVQKLRDAIRTCREAYGHPDVIVTDHKTRDDIKALVHNELMYTNNTYNIAWGIRAIEFEGLPVIVSLGAPTTATDRDLYVLDTSVIELRVLQEPTMMQLASTADWFKFTIKTYLTMIIKHEAACYLYYDLA